MGDTAIRAELRDKHKRLRPDETTCTHTYRSTHSHARVQAFPTSSVSSLQQQQYTSAARHKDPERAKRFPI